MKNLFVYYSNSGNGDVVASYLSENGVDIRKVEPEKKLPKALFPQMMKGGFLATINHKSKLKEFNADISGYDGVMIGSPVWNGRLLCPINTVLASLDLSGKTVSFILYAGGGSAPKAVDKINEKYPGASVVVLKEPKKNADELKKIVI